MYMFRCIYLTTIWHLSTLQSDHYLHSSYHPPPCHWPPLPILLPHVLLAHCLSGNHQSVLSIYEFVFVWFGFLESTYEWNHRNILFVQTGHLCTCEHSYSYLTGGMRWWHLVTYIRLEFVDQSTWCFNFIRRWKIVFQRDYTKWTLPPTVYGRSYWLTFSHAFSIVKLLNFTAGCSYFSPKEITLIRHDVPGHFTW